MKKEVRKTRELTKKGIDKICFNINRIFLQNDLSLREIANICNALVFLTLYKINNKRTELDEFLKKHKELAKLIDYIHSQNPNKHHLSFKDIQEEFSKNLRERFEILEKHNFRCFYCGKTSLECKLQLDHIHPKSKGGKTESNNLAPACFECNLGKTDIPLKRVQSAK